jgi:YXWGXW repeat-containing protein
MIVRRIFLSALAPILFWSISSAAPAPREAAIDVIVAFAPPDLPVYEQPLCPGEDYLWVPGYWDWDGDDYFWVPGTWVLAPEPGFLWTPGYWAWGGNGFFFTAGYWGPVVGFYGGVNYGFGYFGHGYEGGRWERGHFFYNRSVSNINVTVIHNTYNTTIINRALTRVSYNGGNGGINARATREEEAAARERHVAAVEVQSRHIQEARRDRELRVSENHGLPPVAATAKPAELHGSHVVAAREAGAVHGGPGNSANHKENRPEPATERPNLVIHPKDAPSGQRPAPPNTGDSRLDKKYQQEQEKMAEQQAKEREKLQQKQDKEDQRSAKQHDQGRQQETERKHQKETQKLMDKHNQEQQHMQRHQQPKPQSRPAPSKPPEKPH